MGHERVGVLPRSRQWRTLVKDLASAAVSHAATTRIAEATLGNVKHRFIGIQDDRGVQAALGYLLGLTAAHLPGRGTKLIPAIDLAEDPSTLALIQQLTRWVEDNADSTEYAALATRAAADAIGEWTRKNSGQFQLFPADAHTSALWHSAASGAGFSELSRVFLARLTERYLNYFLEREASSEIRTLREREVFSARLAHFVDAVSRHAFESTKITQSFAAGWYNKNARERRPSDAALRGFLSFAFAKLRAELEREKHT